MHCLYVLRTVIHADFSELSNCESIWSNQPPLLPRVCWKIAVGIIFQDMEQRHLLNYWYVSEVSLNLHWYASKVSLNLYWCATEVSLKFKLHQGVYIWNTEIGSSVTINPFECTCIITHCCQKLKPHLLLIQKWNNHNINPTGCINLILSHAYSDIERYVWVTF